MSAKRDDIVSAAITVFQDSGLKGARMEQIAESAKVSKRTLYKYFDSKSAIFDEICILVIDKLVEMKIPTFDQAASLDAQLVTLLSAYFSQTMRARNLLYSRVILTEFMQNPASAKKYEAAFASVDDPVTQFIIDGMNAKLLKEGDPLAATALLLGLFKSTILLPAIWNQFDRADKKQIERVVQETVTVFLSRYT